MSRLPWERGADKRHWIDRLVSLLRAPVRRYRCEQLGCNWEGTFLAKAPAARVEPLLRELTDEKLRRQEHHPEPAIEISS